MAEINQYSYPTNFIPISEEFENALQIYYSKVSHSQNKSILASKTKNLKCTKQSARVLSSWADCGIIANNKSANDKGWRTFTMLDILWIDIVSELRLYGLSVSKLQRSYSSMHIAPNGNTDFPQFEATVTLAMLNRPVYILVFSDGYCQPISRTCLSNYYFIFNTHSQPSFILLDLRNIVSQYFDINSYPQTESEMYSVKMKASEMELLANLRDPKIKDINIVKKNGEIAQIKTTEKPKDLRELQKLAKTIANFSHGSFEGKLNDGVLTYLEVTKTKKF